MTPSLEIGNGNWAVKSDSLLGYKTIDGKYYPREIGVTRATTATRINADGLVELTPYNLLSYSEDFTNGYWVKTNTSITANSINSPIGTLTADTITDNTTSGQHKAQSPDVTSIIGSGNDFYVSAYFKANTATRVAIYAYGSSRGVGVDLTNGTQINVNGLTNAPSSDITITNVGNDWYKVTMKGIVSGSFSIAVMMISGNDFNYIGSGNSLYMWGAQLVEGTEPLDYLPTTDRLDIARIDYSSGEAALLVEPQRTNLLLQSSSFDNVYWTKTNGVLTANNTTSPEGTLTADLFTETTFTNSSASVSNSSLISVTSGVAYTTTIYAKKGNDKYLYLSNYYNSANRYYTLIVDLESGTITKEQAGSLITSFSSSITSVGDGWYRISLTQTTASTQLYFILRISNSATPTIDTSYGFITIPSNNNRSLYIWGAQLEVGAYATSYIPTTSASVTRNVDLTVEKDVTSFGIGNSYTLLFDLTMATEDSNKILFTLKNSSGTNSMTFRNFNNNLRIYDTIGGSYPLASLSNENTKWAFRFDGVNYSLFRVSGGVAVENTATLGTARDIGYFSEINSGSTKASIKYLSIYPSALSDTECEQYVIS